MDAATLLHRFADTIDAHDWEALAELLHEDFTCRYVHTGEVFDKDGWVRLNADYPGFQRFTLEDAVATDVRAVGRAHVTAEADGVAQHFEVASFLTVEDGLIRELTEVWTDVGQTPPANTRGVDLDRLLSNDLATHEVPTPQTDPLQTSTRELGAFADAEVGIWEAGPGVDTDVEADEIFLVLSGKGQVAFDDGTIIELQPGVLVHLREGDRTRWEITERIRKLYVAR